MSDVSIIIQGPLNEISLRNIPIYKKYGKVIVSCWDEYDKELLKYIDDDVIFVCNDLIKVEHCNLKNVYYQAFTTHAGLEMSETEFSIKFRSDESYSNLDTFVKALSENPERIITGDFHFWDNWAAFHISDHAIGGKTKNLLGAFGGVKAICETTPSNVELVIGRRMVGPSVLQPASPESLIMLFFLQQINAINNILLFSMVTEEIKGKIFRIIVDEDISQNTEELIKNHVRIVPTVCMGDVFLGGKGAKGMPSVFGRLIKSGSEELLCVQAYGETFTDIEIGCES
jgi:hypothetical protein